MTRQTARAARHGLRVVRDGSPEPIYTRTPGGRLLPAQAGKRSSTALSPTRADARLTRAQLAYIAGTHNEQQVQALASRSSFRRRAVLVIAIIAAWAVAAALISP